jgi:hypothetical protein
MMDALSSSETSILIRATRRNIPEDGILHDPVGFENKDKAIFFIFIVKRFNDTRKHTI